MAYQNTTNRKTTNCTVCGKMTTVRNVVCKKVIVTGHTLAVMTTFALVIIQALVFVQAAQPVVQVANYGNEAIYPVREVDGQMISNEYTKVPQTFVPTTEMVRGMNVNQLTLDELNKVKLDQFGNVVFSEIPIEVLRKSNFEKLRRQNLEQLKQLNLGDCWSLDNISLEQMEKLGVEGLRKLNIGNTNLGKLSRMQFDTLKNIKLNSIKLDQLINMKMQTLFEEFGRIEKKLTLMGNKLDMGEFRMVDGVDMDKTNMQLNDYYMQTEDGGQMMNVIPQTKTTRLVRFQDEGGMGNMAVLEKYGNLRGQVGFGIAQDGTTNLIDGQQFVDTHLNRYNKVVGYGTDFLVDPEQQKLYVANGGKLGMMFRGRRIPRSALRQLTPAEVSDMEKIVAEAKEMVETQKSRIGKEFGNVEQMQQYHTQPKYQTVQYQGVPRYEKQPMYTVPMQQLQTEPKYQTVQYGDVPRYEKQPTYTVPMQQYQTQPKYHTTPYGEVQYTTQPGTQMQYGPFDESQYGTYQPVSYSQYEQ